MFSARGVDVLGCGIVLFTALHPAIGQIPLPKLTEDEAKLANQAADLNREGMKLYGQNKASDALGKLEESLKIRRSLYPKQKYPDGHPELANSLNNVGFVLTTSGRAEKAVPLLEEAVGIYRKLY